MSTSKQDEKNSDIDRANTGAIRGGSGDLHVNGRRIQYRGRVA
jgi:hypothetical protein